MKGKRLNPSNLKTPLREIRQGRCQGEKEKAGEVRVDCSSFQSS